MWVEIYIKEQTADSKTISDISRKSRIIADLYNKFLAEMKVKIVGVTKISISLVDKPDYVFIGEPKKGLISIVTIDRFYDFKNYIKLDDYSKNKEVLEIINNSIVEVSKKLEWDLVLFNKVYQKVLDCNFKHSYYEIAPKTTRDKSRRAGVYVEMNEDGAQISIIVEELNGKGKPLKIPVIKTHANRMFVKQIVGKGKWLTNKEYILSNKSEEINFKWSIDKGELDLFFSPNNSSENQLIDDLLIAVSTTKKEQIEDLINNRISNLLR